GGILLVGLGFAVIGWIGVFLARLIKAAVSRQREYLADASAVQFTRQTDGIANALKKIGGYKQHSYLEVADAEQVSHMLFAIGARFSSLFATHPPLTDRIRALDPSFDESQYPTVESNANLDGDQRTAGFADSRPSRSAADVASVVDSIGQPSPAHIAYASELHRSIPDDLLASAHSSDDAWLLVLALLVDPDPDLASRQFDLLAQQLGPERVARIRQFRSQAGSLGETYILPLLELSFPALRQGSAQKRDYVVDTGRRLVELDGEIDLREYCLYRLLSVSLRRAERPTHRQEGAQGSRRQIREAATQVLRVLARHGSSESADQVDAFRAGLAHFGKWGRDLELGAASRSDVRSFGAAIRTLEPMGSGAKETLIRAATATVLHDQEVSAREAEMLRTVCAALDCPMPPILGAGPEGL
ncbi:MAG: M48 family metalloprotease, partial [Pseudomonadota bacterium]